MNKPPNFAEDIYPKSPAEDPIIRHTNTPNMTLPPQHRIWERVVDAVQYTVFLVIALFAAIYHIEDKAFWIPYSVISVGILIRSRGGKLDPEVIMKLIGR